MVLNKKFQNFLLRQFGQASLAQWYCRILVVTSGIKSGGLRLWLTVLTMAIGAFGLSATLFIGTGALDGLWVDLDKLMGNRVTIYPDAGPNDVLLKYRKSSALTESDLKFLKEKVDIAHYVVPSIIGRETISFKHKQFVGSVDGIAKELKHETMFQPLQGQFFSSEAFEGYRLECYLTLSAAQKLGVQQQGEAFGSIGLGGRRCEVVGIVSDPPEADGRFKSRVVIPYTWAKIFWGKPNDVGTILVAWKSPHLMEETLHQLRTALDEKRLPGAYGLSSSQFTLKKRKNIVSNFMLVGALQALFSILVASIGIVNVMLANVVQRSKEFAIRMAMGAEGKEIGIIVMVESVVLGFGGAFVGVLLAAISAPVFAVAIASTIPEASALVPKYSISGILLPILVCTLSGFLAGLVPAQRAKKVDVLAILRAE